MIWLAILYGAGGVALGTGLFFAAGLLGILVTPIWILPLLCGALGLWLGLLLAVGQR